MKLIGWALFTLLAVQAVAQTIVGSARVICGEYPYTSGPVVGVIINQTSTTITDLEVELTVLTRNKKGELRTERDTHFVVVPSVNQTGVVTKLQANEHTYFNIPGKRFDQTCLRYGKDEVPNVAALAITRINNKPMLPADRNGKPMKRAPVDSMLIVPRDTPEHVPTLYELIENNARLSATIVNRQLNDCLSRGTWACTFNNDTNINVVISQQ